MKFLLVDDDAIFLFLAHKVVNSLGIADEIYSAKNGRDALNHIDEWMYDLRFLPDIILLDLNMPILNGFDFISAFNQLSFPGKEKMKIIVTSSSANANDLLRVKEYHYLTKPLLPEALMKAITDTIN